MSVVTGCGGDGASAPTPAVVARVEIEPGPTTLVFVGERYQLSAIARDADRNPMPELPITWASSDTGIAVVSNTGLVTARRDGEARITAATAGVIGRVTIGVDVGQAARRCVGCHDPHAGQGMTAFPGATCPACHLPAFMSTQGGSHQLRLAGHAGVARGFTLLGVHDTLACGSCHGPEGPRFRPGGDTDCIACHAADFQARHGASSFPRTCLVCHTTESFRGARYNHDSTGARFRLVGAHTALPCSSCHAPDGSPLFAPRDQNDCVTCHLPDYQRKHAGSGYPTTCPVCHTTTSFLGAQFDHDASFFPINSGTHRGRWTSCATCHPTSGDYSRFSCFSCHEHNQVAMDGEHRGRAGYRYAPEACLSCHPSP